jgi:hypothetical protein
MSSLELGFCMEGVITDDGQTPQQLTVACMFTKLRKEYWRSQDTTLGLFTEGKSRRSHHLRDVWP